MNALVIGGTGFMGRRLVRNLLEEQVDVTVATRGKSPNPFGERVRTLKIDRFDEVSLKSQLPSGTHFDVLYDQVGFGPEDIETTISTFRDKIGRYIFTSSVAIYPEEGSSMAETLFKPDEYEMKDGGIGNLGYAEGKRSAEAYLVRNAPFPVTIFRPPMVVGPDDVTGRLQKHVNWILNGEEIVIPSPRGKMNFIWVEDAGRFLSWLGTEGKTGIYNAASPRPQNAAEIVEKLAESLGKKAVISESGNDENKSSYYISKERSISVEKAEKEGFKFTPVNEWVPDVAKKTVETGGKSLNNMDYLRGKL